MQQLTRYAFDALGVRQENMAADATRKVQIGKDSLFISLVQLCIELE